MCLLVFVCLYDYVWVCVCFSVFVFIGYVVFLIRACLSRVASIFLDSLFVVGLWGFL